MKGRRRCLCRVAVVNKHDGTRVVMAVQDRFESTGAFRARCAVSFANCGGMGTLEECIWGSLAQTDPALLSGFGAEKSA